MSVIFFNSYHNGDIHLSRTFVKSIINKFPEYNYLYSHKNGKEILKDIDNLSYVNYDNYLEDKNYHTVFERHGDLYINTWYGVDSMNYLNKYGLTYDCLYHVFNNALNIGFNISLENINKDPFYFFPEIDYNKLDISFINKINLNNKYVLLCNGQSKSGQSVNFDFSSIAKYFIDKNYYVIVTNDKLKFNDSKILYSREIINKKESDINETSYLGMFCDYIIGRSSGVQTFCINKNIFNRDIKYISFSNIKFNSGIYWIGDLYKNYNFKIKTFNFDANNEHDALKFLYDI